METDSTNPEAAQTTLADARLKAFAMCMICSVEYPPESVECLKCGVQLSLVRRCYNCSRVVSAKHRRCIHCGQAFFPEGKGDESPEDALDRIAAIRKQREATKRNRKVRALSVTVGTFLLVFSLAMVLTHKLNTNTDAAVIATSYVLRPAELRRAPSHSSANTGMLAGSEIIEITGYTTAEREQRWIALKWNDRTAYMPIDDVAPPKPTDAIRGCEVLKFYIVGIEDPAIIAEATKAVTYYNQTFPASSTLGQELRWILAERARVLAARGKFTHELLAEARRQYQILMDANGDFAKKARAAMNAPLSAVKREGTSRDRPEPENGVKIIGDQPDSQTITGFGRNPAHEVMLLEHANIAVQLSRPGTLKPESDIGCSVARSVQSNGRVVIPAGTPCQVKIANLQDKTATLTLATVTVRNRSYNLITSTSRIQQTIGSQTIGQELSFQLKAPVAFTK